MVIQMGRSFVAASWLNADENDYSGKQQSHMVGRMANISAYADVEEKPAKKVKKVDLRTNNQRFEDRLDARRVAFEKAFENSEISFEQYDLLLSEWEKSMARLEKRMGIVEEFNEVESKPSRPSIMPSIERAASSFASHHPFATLVGVIVLGSMIMNFFGYGA